MDVLMTAYEAAGYLRLNYMTLCRLARQGKVPAVKIGGEWRFKKEVLDGMFGRESQSTRRPVLVIDDDPRVRDVLADIVDAGGYQAVPVGTGEEALAKIKGQSFDLIFLDLVLPDMSGVDLLKSIKQYCPGSAVAVVTGYGDDPIAAEAISLGPMILLRKPFAVQDVRQVLRLAYSKAASTISGKIDNYERRPA